MQMLRGVKCAVHVPLYSNVLTFNLRCTPLPRALAHSHPIHNGMVDTGRVKHEDVVRLSKAL